MGLEMSGDAPDYTYWRSHATSAAILSGIHAQRRVILFRIKGSNTVNLYLKSYRELAQLVTMNDAILSNLLSSTAGKANRIDGDPLGD